MPLTNGVLGLSLARPDPVVPDPMTGGLGTDTSQLAAVGCSTFDATALLRSFALALPAQSSFHCLQ